MCGMRHTASKAIHPSLTHDTDESEREWGTFLLGPHFQMALGERILIPSFPNLVAKSEAFPSLKENENKNPLKMCKWTNEVCLLFFQFLVSDKK